MIGITPIRRRDWPQLEAALPQQDEAAGAASPQHDDAAGAASPQHDDAGAETTGSDMTDAIGSETTGDAPQQG